MLMVSRAELAGFFTVSSRTLSNWSRAGMPRAARGRYDLRAVLDWWLENIHEAEAKQDAQDEPLKAAKRKYWGAKAEREEIKAKIERGAFVSVDEMVDSWCARASEMVALLESLKDRLPSLLEGRSRADMRQIVEQEIYNLRKAYVRAGTHTPEPSDEDIAGYIERKSA